MEPRTITIKGTGRAISRPDQITIPITLTAKDLHYKKTMDISAQQHAALQAALAHCGIQAKDIKTSDYSVDASYESKRDMDGNYTRHFVGYECVHQLQIRFDLDMERLGSILDAISGCIAEPDCSIEFSVKDTEPMMQEVLKNAAENARKKAEILARASGVALGELLHIDYSWTDLVFTSETVMKCKALNAPMGGMESMSIEPEDISASENVTFTWAIS